MNETQVVQGVALVAHDQTPEVLQPGEDPLHCSFVRSMVAVSS